MHKKLLLIIVLFLFIGFISCSKTPSEPPETSSDNTSETFFETSSFDFRKAKWGMSVAQVKATESGTPLKDDKVDRSHVLIYSDTIANLKCKVYYIFANDKFAKAKYLITEEHTNKAEYLSDYQTLSDKISENYGKPLKENTIWMNDLYKDDPSKWGIAVAKGDLKKYTYWQTSETIVILYLIGDEFKVDLGMEFGGSEFRPLEEKTFSFKK